MARRKRNRTEDAKKESAKENNSPNSIAEGAETSEVAKGGTKTNDPAWYARDERLAKDGANIPFNLPFGSHVPVVENIMAPTPHGTNFSNSYTNSSIAGICSLVIKPSFGTNDTKSDPVNVCANAFYTHVRYINSGRKNYDPADLFIYAAAFGDIYSFVLWMERIYAYAFMYSQRNYYVGKHLITANGVNANNIIANLANFRYFINSVINKVSSFCLPGDIYYFKRRAFMFSNYYIENPYGNIKDQLYQFVPEGFYRYEISGVNSAGALRYLKITDMVQTGVPLVVDDFQTIFESLMQNITGDEDFGLMSGDVLKAYGSNIIGLPQMGEDAALMPVYDPYVLSQFKNACIIEHLYRADPSATFTIGTDSYIYGDLDQAPNGLLISRESCDMAANDTYSEGLLARINKPLTVENPDPGIGDVLEGTRLMLGWDDVNSSFECGTEIVVNASLSYLGYNFPDPLTKVDSYRGNFQWSDTPIGGAHWWYNLHTNFKYAPWLMYVHLDNAQMIDNMVFKCNMDNTTTLTNDMVRRIHEIALLSLFYVPGVAKLVS